MWSKKWYLKRNISCDVHLLNELLETDVPWDDAIVVSAGKLRKVWDSLSELRSSVWKATGKDSSKACVVVFQNCAVYWVFPSGMTQHSKIAQFNWECIGCLTQPRSLGCPDCSLVTILTELSRLLNKRILTPRILIDFVTLVIPIKETEDTAITGEDWFEGRRLNFLK
jgi:hypothetical protein